MSNWECQYCGLVLADEAERERHEAGVDEKHLACAHQDIDLLKAQQSAQQRSNIFGRSW
jgi:hypothetical protein